MREISRFMAALSMGESSLPFLSKRPPTSTTRSYNGSGFCIPISNKSGRCWFPIRSRSANPLVTRNPTRAPFRSNKAFVPRVVAKRISSGGKASSSRLLVRILAAKRGGSSGECSSHSSPEPSTPIASSSSTELRALSHPITVRLSFSCPR